MRLRCRRAAGIGWARAGPPRRLVQRADHPAGGGPAKRLVEVEHHRRGARLPADGDASGEPLIVLGGGSNLVVVRRGLGPCTVVAVRTSRRRRGGRRRHEVLVTVAAGETVGRPRARSRSRRAGPVSRRCRASPGRSARPRSRTSAPTARRSPRSSLGATSYDRRDGERRRRVSGSRVRLRLPHAAPSSASPERFVVLAVHLRLRRWTASGAPVRYAELAGDAGRRPGWPGAAGSASARRCSPCGAGKGMVLDADDHDTWSAGSFFTNPVADAASPRFPTQAPRWERRTGRSRPRRPG